MVTTRSKTRGAVAALKSPISNPKSLSPCPQPTRLPATRSKQKRSKPVLQSPRPTKKAKLSKQIVDATPLPLTPISVVHDDSEDDIDEEGFCGMKTFGQDTAISYDQAIEEMHNLEFYQAYPHNRAANLCRWHFGDLLVGWYHRCLPAAQQQLDEILKGDLSCELDFSHLAIPVDQDTGELMELEDFCDLVLNEITNAQIRMRVEEIRVITCSSHVPVCEIIKDEYVQCFICAEEPEQHRKWPHYDFIPLQHTSKISKKSHEAYMKLRTKFEEDSCCRLGCGHDSAVIVLGGDNGDVAECEECPHLELASKACQCKSRKYAVRVAGTRIPVEVGPARMAMDSRYGHVDVGGIHLLVDACASGHLVKFR
ncbi:hypothetical protein FZEAL_4672 [Fusarium zealandicum]|uniref:Uncharacterized protein n=1 Tax=Fusarium zealandicum TaxID=1053134 RepID=A0A8H4XLN6_9HYPO|nr:hypothetical protein FZEAL_4672 [Fusarium zealandicum]